MSQNSKTLLPPTSRRLSSASKPEPGQPARKDSITTHSSSPDADNEVLRKSRSFSENPLKLSKAEQEALSRVEEAEIEAMAEHMSQMDKANRQAKAEPRGKSNPGQPVRKPSIVVDQSESQGASATQQVKAVQTIEKWWKKSSGEGSQRVDD